MLSKSENAKLLDNLKAIIRTEVFITKDRERIASKKGGESNWLFDFRRVLLKPDVLKAISDVFLEKFGKEFPLQIGGIEVAAIPLITGVVMGLDRRGIQVNGFFIRKSRKKVGLLRMIEGNVTSDRIILVDDIINTGKSFFRQVEVIESLGKKVDAVFAILRFRDIDYYKYFHEKGIKVESLFSLDDFSDSLKVKNLVDKKEKPVPMPFKTEWCFKSEKPNYYYVVPKSAPIIDETKLYFGADNGNFWAIHQTDGSVAWKYRVGFHAKGKNIFSSPALYNNQLFFGAYDGNFYCLDKNTGKPQWIFMEADWIGSSPCIADNLGLVFVGLEFGLWKKQGGIVALDIHTGKKKWQYSMTEMVHSSPAYSSMHSMVIIGGNDNVVRAFDARSGTLRWEFKTQGAIKESLALSSKLVAFGSFDSYVYILEIETGKLVKAFKTGEPIYSTPLFFNDKLYVSSLDKILYCIDPLSGGVLWQFRTGGRVLASPIAIEGKIYIGSNDGRLYELDSESGKNTGFFQSVERITNAIAYNGKTRRFFVPTFANEIYCLTRKEDSN